MLAHTLSGFGYPGTLVAEYDHWYVIIRQGQVTLGSLIVITKHEARAFADVPEAACTELHRIFGDIKAVLGNLFAYDQINFLALMMVDPEAHFHVIPRYAAAREFAGQSFADSSWPKPPDLSVTNACEPGVFTALHAAITKAFNERRATSSS